MAETLSPTGPLTRHLTDRDVERLVSWPEAVAALKAAYAEPVDPASVPGRSTARGPGHWLRSLPAVSPAGDYAGAKLISASATGGMASYLLALFDATTMELAGLMDANFVTGMRTAATSAVAVDAIAPQQPLDLAILGSGFEAFKHLAALAQVRGFSRVRVFSPRAESRQRFIAKAAAELGIEVESARDAESAVASAELVVCAARSRDESPILHGDWLADGSTVVSIGSTVPEQREIDWSTLDRAARVVADVVDEVLHDTGDGIEARARGVDLTVKCVALTDVVSGRITAREAPDQIVVYKSVGSALQDITVGALALRRALASDVGYDTPSLIVPVPK
ncbi:ornithine cyclodeaminase family protein [Nocardioides sp.]|uniref:ornithine cyclodeaminase family protein n=1 Tax=Nocardioides sp. TaxID=35761 RepID=UPI0039E2B147